jgi:serine/threonine protein kinase
MTPNHYKTLHLDPGADPEVLKAAYKVLAKKHGSDDRKLKAVELAGEVLLDPDQRAEYDRQQRKLVGKIVGEYRFLEKIAEGGFGETYKAEHVLNKKLACIKYALNLDPEDETMLIEEAGTIWDLRHYGIPAVKGLLRMPDNKLALVMSYVPGLTLAQYIEHHYQTGMDAEHVAWITERVLNILKYLHMHGVVHGDVKPQNIIIEAEKHTVVVVDYGLSMIKPKGTTPAKGYTPYFAAPEQEAFSPPIPETDLYGLGMTMIFALGGDVEHVNVPPNTPKAMCAFIKSLIRRDPLKRPKVWQVDLCETIKEVRQQDFGRTASGMKPLKV